MAIWMEEKKILEFTSMKTGTQSLRINDLQGCIKNLIHDLQVGIKNLLPSEMGFPNSHVHEFLDQPTGKVFFIDTEHSQKILGPLYQEYEKGHRDILNSVDLVTAWLKEAEHFLHLLLATLLVSGGKIPRMDAVGGCRIRGFNRNILHMSGSPIWADSLTSELQSYPPEVAWPLYFYLGIIRPFTIKVLTARGALSDLGRLNEYMFVHISPLNREDRRWTRGDTSTVVDQFFGKPLGLKLDYNDLRHIFCHIIKKHILPGMPALPQFSQRIYNTMANHTSLTANRNYGIDDISNLAVDRFQTIHFLAVSRAFQVWCQLISPNQELPSTGATSSTLSHIHIEAARQGASLAIAKEYQFNCAEQEALQHQLVEIIGYWRGTWFTLGEREREFPSSEDQVLVKVLATLLLKAETPDSGWAGFSNSSREELVVTALMLVSDTLYNISPS